MRRGRARAYRLRGLSASAGPRVRQDYAAVRDQMSRDTGVTRIRRSESPRLQCACWRVGHLVFRVRGFSTRRQIAEISALPARGAEPHHIFFRVSWTRLNRRDGYALTHSARRPFVFSWLSRGGCHDETRFVFGELFSRVPKLLTGVARDGGYSGSELSGMRRTRREHECAVSPEHGGACARASPASERRVGLGRSRVVEAVSSKRCRRTAGGS